jgi:hypothetical protein
MYRHFASCVAAGLLFSIALVLGCKKKDDPKPTTIDEYGPAGIEITHAVGNRQLHLDTSWYVTDLGDSLKVHVYKYYISNVQLEQANGAVWSMPESYFLVDESDSASKLLEIPNIPAGTYTRMHFLIGVDSARNVSGTLSGALSADKGMFWTWNSGFIMAKLEGTSPSSKQTDKSVVYHVGGYTGESSGIRKVTMDLTGGIRVASNRNPEIHLRNDLLEWFKTPTNISIADLSSAMDVRYTGPLAHNYADMFVLDHIHDD